MMRILKNTTCRCGANLKSYQKKYCSSKCLYTYRIRPCGLKYKLVRLNPTSFKKGNKPWNKGLTISDSRVKRNTEKGAITKKGRHCSVATEFKKGDNKGKLNNNWKGGKTSENILLRHSLEYKQWRTTVFKRDNYTCQLCGRYGGFLNANHIKKWAYYPKLRFDVDNGITLCKKCHFSLVNHNEEEYKKHFLNIVRRKKCGFV